MGRSEAAMPLPVVFNADYYSDIGQHVFPTEKFRLIYEGLCEQIEQFERRVYRPQPATQEQLLRVHTPQYIDDLNAYRHSARTVGSELPISKQIIDAYYLMTGGSCLAAQLAVEHGAAMNLGGGFHHAFADRAEGFCYINDVAVAVRDILATRPIERAAVIDTDLHQGNGTAHIFANDPAVFTFSIHQQNNYPIKQRSDLDIGLADNTEDEEYLQDLNNALQHIFGGFGPQFIVYVAGVDPYREDQLGGLRLSIHGIQERDEMVLRFCRDHAVPAAVVTAGGYARHVRDTVTMHINTYLALSP